MFTHLPEEEFDKVRKQVMEILSSNPEIRKEAPLICVSVLNELFRTTGPVYHLQSFGAVSSGDIKIY